MRRLGRGPRAECDPFARSIGVEAESIDRSVAAVSGSKVFPSEERRLHPKVASVGATLIVMMLVAVVWMGLAAGAARAGTATNVTFKQDVSLSSRSSLPWPTDNCRSDTCRQRVEIEIIDRSGGFKPPLEVGKYDSVDLGAVEFFEVTDSYAHQGSSFSYFYLVSVHGGAGPLTLTLTELHRGTYSSAFQVDVRCRRWRSSTGSLPVSCSA